MDFVLKKKEENRMYASFPEPGCRKGGHKCQTQHEIGSFLMCRWQEKKNE